MKALLSGALWLWTALVIVPSAASAQESAKVEVPDTQNPYIPAVATLYEQAKQEEALSKLEKALEWKSNGPQEMLFLKLMKGVLLAELGLSGALESFKEALAQDAQARLPVQASWRVRKLFEQARNTSGPSADEELPTEQLEPTDGSVLSSPPHERYGLSLSVRGEEDLIKPGTAFGYELGGPDTPFTYAVSLGYSWEQQGGVLTLLWRESPGLRLEGQVHPLSQDWLRPYARAGVAAFFWHDSKALTVFGGRWSIGVDMQWDSGMFVFADLAYEHFFNGGERNQPLQYMLFSMGVGVFTGSRRASSEKTRSAGGN